MASKSCWDWDMVMVNISKSFYHLRRVSANGLADDIDLCGQETSKQLCGGHGCKEKNGNVGETYKGNYFYKTFLLDRLNGKINSQRYLL